MATPRIAELLDSLQSFYGAAAPHAPADPYEFLVWWHCGYPPSEERCAKGWQALRSETDIAPRQLSRTAPGKLAKILKAGGMVPELRAARLKEIAQRVQNEFAGDLRSALARLPVSEARKMLKTFPGIGDPGADRITLFSRLAPAAAVPSACPHVLVRLIDGPEGAKYTATYATAQLLLDALPASVDARIRAYLLIDRHGRTLCKRSKPKCVLCPLQARCAFAIEAAKPE